MMLTCAPIHSLLLLLVVVDGVQDPVDVLRFGMGVVVHL